MVPNPAEHQQHLEYGIKTMVIRPHHWSLIQQVWRGAQAFVFLPNTLRPFKDCPLAVENLWVPIFSFK